MAPELLVEISSTRSGGVPAGLIVRAYKASRFQQIALVLNRVSAVQVNKVLDPVVQTMPLDIPGVIYVDVSDRPRLHHLLGTARMIVASTSWLRSAAFRAGLDISRTLPGERASTRLDELLHTNGHLG